MRYKISAGINFSSVPGYLIPAGKKNADGILLIKDDIGQRQFLINETTRIFIEKFTTPKTFDEVNKEIADEVKASADTIKKMIRPFFRYIRHRHFIVPEDHTSCKADTGPLFNPGAILGRYTIEKVIDNSHDVDIYKSTGLEAGHTVIIKLLKQPDKKKAEEFKREFGFLKALSKTGVVPGTYELVTEKRYIFFSQGFIDGMSLSQFIRRKQRSTLALILTIAGNILHAFKKIHDKNIVHGDIHPGNILVTGENKIKIIDFGLALNNELDKDELVNFGGVYFFMPPERIKKTTSKKFTRKPDFYSDIFQLGIVLYVLLYDEHPFNGITWEELAAEIKEKQIRFPERAKYNFQVPVWVKDIITKCVAKKPGYRFANAHELYNAFSKNIKDNARKIRPAVKI